MVKKEAKNRFFSLQNVFGFTKKLFSFLWFAVSALITLFMIFVFASIFSAFFLSVEDIKGGNVEVIPITGIIATGGDMGLFGEKITVSDKIVKELGKAEKNDAVKAVILEIDSPGGAPVASYEIVNAVKKMKKPVIAVIRETGASGAFWVAASASKIYANPLSITGSIGVLASHLEFAGLMKRYNITYRRLVAGKFKDAGSKYKEMSEEEQSLYQRVIDRLHDEFINSVAQNRKMPVDKVRELADGFILLGKDAKEKGLIDELGGKEEAIKFVEQKLNITAQVFEYREKGGLKELIAGMLDKQSFWFGKGFGSILFAKETVNIVV